MEERGHVRRGYFVNGLGAAQFALPGAVDRLRDVRERHDSVLHPESQPDPIVLVATDPAQPYGSTLPWPMSEGRPSRSAGALVVLHEGEPLVWFDARAHSLVMFPAAEHDASWAESFAKLVKDGRRRSIEIRKIDGIEIDARHECVPILERAGFVGGYRGWVLRD